MEEGLGDSGGGFLEHLLPHHLLEASPDTSPFCPKPQHPNSLPPPLWAQQGTGAQTGFLLSPAFQKPQPGAESQAQTFSVTEQGGGTGI